jgi:hypothetical protein
METIRSVFISHIHEDDEDLASLKSLLSTKNYTIRDSSINSSRPNDAESEDYIKSGILAPRIRQSGTFLVLVSDGTRNSEWVNWEIEYATKLGKRVVGIFEHGAADADVPEALTKYADAVVGWDADRIIDAIEGRINNWQCSDGSPASVMQIARYGC